ncbi:MAG: ATP synthase F1 subunit delta [Phycisphaerae bacterium]
MPETLDRQLELADVYAQALFELALAQDAVADVRAELDALAGMVAADDELAAFFRSEALDSERRAGLLEKWFRGKLSDLVLNTLLVANRNGRVGFVEPLRRAFVLRQERAAGQVEAVATTAVPLDDAGREQVRAIAGKLSGQQPLVDFRVDEQILGGLILQIGDWRYDDSVRRQLRGAAQRLRTRGELGLTVGVEG